ncbi:hypothetical protein ACPOL_6935 (plasmid) [Acidisarcina polymorpha]|uniref:Uncharacterized protein n=1 Tax=Acidisarcina polymorpha TaxID=2211140 RepID=A0A2Z5GBD4_9BACT|nr:hypothetical protein [Acidisarcina polymorpha]AXC16117.1 hypothetical protein ACPOL_6909 [Acidisarcina polymorpha]AXC16139.1 hypothetical protein ACPOL_6935 [Acidisarcina polymorpha]
MKWSRDLYPIRERAANARTETWGRLDIERLFGVGRASAQGLMKAIGEVQPVGRAHFVERTSLLGFLDAMIAAEDFDEAFRSRMREADAPPYTKPLKVSLPAGLRTVMLRDLPPNISLTPGRLEIIANSSIAMLESLALLAQAMQNDFLHVQAILDPCPRLPQAKPTISEPFSTDFVVRGKVGLRRTWALFPRRSISTNDAAVSCSPHKPSAIAARRSKPSATVYSLRSQNAEKRFQSATLIRKVMG